MVGRCWVVMVGRWWVDGGICVLVVVFLQVLCVCVGVCVYRRKKMWTSFDLLKGNLAIAHRVQRIVDSTRTGFFQNGPLSSFPILRVLFTNPKSNFSKKSPKRALDIDFFQTSFLGWKSGNKWALSELSKVLIIT